MFGIQFQGLIEIDQRIGVAVHPEILDAFRIPALSQDKVVFFGLAKFECESKAMSAPKVSLSRKGIIDLHRLKA